MTSFNSLAYTYSTRRNAPFPDTTSEGNIRRSQAWMLKAMLKDEISTGTFAGSRTPESVWTHVASSNGVTTSTTTDLWGSTFDVSKLVFGTDPFASFTSPQSWIVLENAALGYQMCICFAVDPYVLISFTKATLTEKYNTFQHDRQPLSTYAFKIRDTVSGLPSLTYGWNGYVDDYSVGSTYYAHLVTNSVDGQFWFLVNRPGTGVFNHFLAFQKTAGNDPSDTRNLFVLGHSTPRGRGVMNSANTGGYESSYFQASNCLSGQNAAGIKLADANLGLGPRTLFSGFNYTANYGIDALSGQYNAFPVGVMTLEPATWRGYFPDWYQITRAPVGAAIPAAGASQQRIVVGDSVIPFVGGSPLL